MVQSEEPRLSIIIVYTDLKKLAESRAWIEKQSICDSIECIALDNRESRFSSAAKALNYGAEVATGEILVFMHQDVYLWDLSAMESYRAYLQKNSEDIIGVAGKLSDRNVVMDIWETKDKIQSGVRANGQIYEVKALDECLFAMTRQTWQKLRFDEVCCNNWHGYAMDICMANTLSGGRNVMVPLKICHDSLGNAETNGFRNTMGHLVRKYRRSGITVIHGTCIQLKCSLRSYYWYRMKGFIKDILKALGLR